MIRVMSTPLRQMFFHVPPPSVMISGENMGP